MFFDKQAVLDHISEMVGPDQAAQAAQMLPDQVDHEQHAALLQQFGIDPQSMVSQLAQQFGAEMGGSGQQGQRGSGDAAQGGYGDREESPG
ncbi:MAG TPA: hypothetical protein VE953_09410 [Terriglobales bacterium]|nr:hypothetical protein [Terriglobales bacterium]